VEPTSHPLKQQCGCGSTPEKDPHAPRTLAAADVHPDSAVIFDIRREADFAASSEIIPGAMWKNPEKIDLWVGALPRTLDLVVYCVRGGGVSNSVVDRLHAEGIKARYIEGGIEAWKSAGGETVTK